ncbi:unnamed protein product [Allacma fusca]|uniref:SAM-dependent MTase RsmB/NOP-type domain-containing protein n=1 Tax=Allacma fusca TaxID=39272 RepID=A0A8J2PGH6_9HEXA|nr:unnamed protein product [Allacma fusca]
MEQSSFVHSVKVPKLYKVASKTLQSIESHEESFKGAIFAAKHPNKKALTALISTSLQRSEEINYLIKKSKILEKEQRIESQLPLVKILITELLRGKLVDNQRQAKPILTVLKYKEAMEKASLKFSRKPSNLEEKDTTIMVEKPRYVRVNTLKMTVDDAVEHLLNEGWIEKPYDTTGELTVTDFSRDDVVDNLLVFAPKQTFYKHPLYLNGTFILQDKASCLAAMALKPRTGRCVLDACAAPGMKTTFLSSLAGTDSRIIAVEKSAKRCNTLKEMLNQYGCEFVEVLNQDFTEVDPLSYEDVEYILVDPSCSGSGMYGRFDVPYQDGSKQDRLHSLSFYQQKVLCHAMKFPNVKRIVYSTCSINSEENEDVVSAALSFAEMCVKCDFDNDRTDGFFIAVIERIRRGG